MVEINTLKIAVAAVLHDIGKFSERAKYPIHHEYVERNQMLYQPKYKQRYTHQHALHTAYFFDEFRDYFPKTLLTDSDAKRSLINLAAKHHCPESNEQIIIQLADKLSSGIERKRFKEVDSEPRAPEEIPLTTILEDISINNKWRENKPENFFFAYPLEKLSPLSIFPISKEKIKLEYERLFQEFIDYFKKLPHKDSPYLWFEHLDSLLFVFTTSIPSATVTWTEQQGFTEIISDISLYDHGRLTAAVATALYLYHEETNSMNEESIKDKEKEKFLIIEGNFYGIQSFIFSEGGTTVKNAAKILRGRSFYVSLLSELSARFLLDHIGLPITSVVTNAAGKFKIIAPNTKRTHKIIQDVEDKINQWLLKHFYGEVSIGISFTQASYNDFIESDRFSQLLKKIAIASEEKKFKKFNILRYAGSVSTYLDDFSSEFGVCGICNRRAARGRNKVEDEYLCDICYDQIMIGKNLTIKNRIAITTVDAELHEKLRVPIFDSYQLSFVTGHLSELVKDGKLISLWDINSLWQESEPFKDGFISIKLINGYVPKFTEEYNSMLEKLTYKESEEEIKNTEEAIRQGSIISFHHLAKLSLIKDETGYRGVDALGVFKADVDNLGSIFTYGLREEKRTFSRYTALSRQLNLFFTLYLPYLCKTEFKNIYTIFAGGDDLFLVGPWGDMIEFSKRLRKDFDNYCCKNIEITLSAGLIITKSETPVLTMATLSEEAVDLAKSNGKNKITVFNTAVSWSEMEEFETINNELSQWLDEEILKVSFVYKLNEILNMAEKENKIKQNPIFDLEQLNALTWRAKLYYNSVRNIAKNKPKEQRVKFIEDIITKTVNWLETYRGSLRIPLWQTIYTRRKA